MTTSTCGSWPQAVGHVFRPSNSRGCKAAGEGLCELCENVPRGLNVHARVNACKRGCLNLSVAFFCKLCS